MPWTPTFFLIASAVLLLAFAPTQLDSADRDTTQQVERTRPYKRPALIQPRENDIVIRRGESRLELYRVVTRVGGVDGTETFTALESVDAYTCTHDPPQEGDTCECGGTGNWLHDHADCALLKIDCVDGAFDEDESSCSNWDGDPLPDFPEFLSKPVQHPKWGKRFKPSVLSFRLTDW